MELVHGVNGICKFNLHLKTHSVPECEEKLQILTSLCIGGTEVGTLRYTYFDLIHF